MEKQAKNAFSSGNASWLSTLKRSGQNTRAAAQTGRKWPKALEGERPKRMLARGMKGYKK